METRKCLECGEKLLGRPDKKYCDDQCRSDHYHKHHTPSQIEKRINTILRKNRSILMQLWPQAQIDRIRMAEKGFNFSFYTHTNKLDDGKEYLFCYEYGYTLISKQNYLLIKTD